MSIIHDALKKVQNTSTINQPSTPLSPAPPSQNRPEAVVHAAMIPSERESNTLLTFALIGILSLIVIAILVILFILAKETTRHSPTIQPAMTAPAPETPPSMPTPAPADHVQTTENIRIQGVMNQGSKTVALINDNIYEEGQTIFGKKIIEIKLNKIVIMDNGQRRVLPVDSKRK